jgi:hypothetical protein
MSSAVSAGLITPASLATICFVAQERYRARGKHWDIGQHVRVGRRAHHRDVALHAFTTQRIDRFDDGVVRVIGGEDRARLRMLDDIAHLRRLAQQIQRVRDESAVHRREQQPRGLDTVAHEDGHDIARTQPRCMKTPFQRETFVAQCAERQHVVAGGRQQKRLVGRVFGARVDQCAQCRRFHRRAIRRNDSIR